MPNLRNCTIFFSLLKASLWENCLLFSLTFSNSGLSFLKLGAIVSETENVYFEVTNENIDRNRMRSKRIWTDLI